MVLTEKQISERTVYNGLIVNVKLDKVELPDGRQVPREVVEHPGGVTIVPVYENNDVAVVTQYRYPFSKELIELPAGKLEHGEEPLACAIRELSEETGLIADKYVYLGAIYPSPGFCKEILHIYLATGLMQGNAHPDEGELLKIGRMPLDDLIRDIMNDKVRDAKTIAAVFKAKYYLGI